MNDYVEVRVSLTPCSEVITDVLAALLADAGFESFVPDENGLTAYIRSSDYRDEMAEIVRQLPFECSSTWDAVTVEGRDWNHEWEKNYFQPIVVDDQCVIHSSFHTSIPRCRYDIVIDPKMAFGTGHHSTTWLMISRLLESGLTGRKVIDMGTGTGILAILAAMRGAARVAGIELDEAAYVNAMENIALNDHAEITLVHGDASALRNLGFKADLFMANINRNVITSDIALYADAVVSGADMFLSGFYEKDVDIVASAAEKCGFEKGDVTIRNEWACLHLIK